MKRHNGHPSWNHWNVALWVESDQGLYTLALESARSARSTRDAAKHMLEALHYMDIHTTPDGAKFTVPTLAAAIRRIR